METRTGCIRVLISAASPLVRKGIVGDLSGADGVEVVCQAANKLELIECVHKSNPDVVILSEDTTNGSGIPGAVGLIYQKAPGAKVLLIVKEHDDGKEIAALRMGVKGFLTESLERDDLIKCVKTIAGGGMWVRRKILEKLVQQLLPAERMLQNGSDMTSPPVFSRREMEIMMLVGRGCRNKEIGRDLHLNEKTVKHYVSKVFKKLHIKKRTEVRRYLELAL